MEFDDVHLQDCIRKFDAMSPRPQSLQRILEVSTTAQGMADVNAFLRDEFCIRCAERICMLEDRLPAQYKRIPELRSVYEKHVRGFVEMRNVNPLDDKFVHVVRDIVERGRDMVSLLVQGIDRLLHHPETVTTTTTPTATTTTTTDTTTKHEAVLMDEASTNKFMNEFLLNRIGSNILLSQYWAVVTGDDPPHPTSIVDPHCDVTAICRRVAQDVRYLCYNETKYRPTIRVQAYYESNDMESFAFIPAALSYIVQELLKNSAIATAHKHQKKKKQQQQRQLRPSKTNNALDDDDTTISVVICADPKRVLIHIGDHAGGIPFEVGQHIWSYLYTTKQEQQSDEEDDEGNTLEDDTPTDGATELGGYGVGLPLSRLYASYLGGNIHLVSLPGYGTHAYIVLPRLPEEMVETVPVRATGWQAHRAEFVL